MPRAKQEAQSETGTAVVTIALKHPTGVIIEAFEPVKMTEPVLGGGSREYTIYRATGKQYALNGSRVPFGSQPGYEIVGGYALTHGIPKDVWDKWLEQHPDSPLVENDLIRAFETINDAKAYAKEYRDARHGMEPLLTKGDPRVDKRRTRDGKFVDAIETADEQAAAA